MHIIDPVHRLRAVNALKKAGIADAFATDSEIYTLSGGLHCIYFDKFSQILYNITATPALVQEYPGLHLVHLTDDILAQNSVLESVKRSEEERERHLEGILRERYEETARQNSAVLMRCRSCGSSNISWEQKQTRGADEAMTVFLACSKCGQRWKMS